MKFLRCEKCGKTVGVIVDHGCPTMCCGEEMKELVANTTDAATEKHVPVVEVSGNTVTVTVGSVEHPMMEAHYIQWIALETKEGMQRKSLTPDSAPKAVFALAEGDAPVRAYEYCNLHGLWAADI